LTAALAMLALALPGGASAANVGFTVSYTGSGAGEVLCKITEPGEEAVEEEFCDGPWPASTKIAFEIPQPEANSEFKGFQGTGNAAGCAKACSFKLTEASSVDVRFDLVVRTLKIAYAGAGEGEVAVECELEFEECPELDEGAYPKGAEITLTGMPESGSEFLGFLNGTGSATGCVGTSPCAFTLQADSTVSARFGLPALPLTVSVQGGGAGTVLSSPAGISCGALCSAEFEEGTEIVLTATPASGSAFAGFEGACTGTDTCSFTLTDEAEVSAVFEPLPTPVTPTALALDPPAGTRSCKVPRLAGKSLKAARTALRAAGCSVGKVRKPRRSTGGKLVVRTTTPGAGATLRAGAPVGLRLAPKRKR